MSDDLVQPVFPNAVAMHDDAEPIHVVDPHYSANRLFSETGRWFQAVGCDDPGRNGTYAEGEAISLPDLVGEAFGLLDPPQPAGFGTSPPDSVATDQFPVVNVPTWFWVDDPYRTTTFTARARFPTVGPPRVWADAHALPDDSEWLPGDGTPWIDCPGLGKVWHNRLEEDDVDCSHTYRRASVFEPDDTYTVVGRVWFETWWTSSLGGSNAGPLPPLGRESVPVPLRVGEIQIVNTYHYDPDS